MKHALASLAIGACLLVSSAGVVFATNAHNVLGTTGQNGTTGQGKSQTSGVASCGSTVPGTTIVEASPPGQVGNLNTNSPFPTSPAGPNSPPNYAGTSGSQSNPHANSQYDNACFQHQMP
jgi:hypothetical protein